MQLSHLQKLESEKGFPEAWINQDKTKNKFFNLGKKNDYNKLLNKNLINEMNKAFKDQIEKFKFQ